MTPHRRARTRLLAVPAAAIVALGLAQGAAASGAATASAPAIRSVVLGGQVVPGLARMRDLGALDPTTQVDVALVPGRDDAAVRTLEASLYDPHSPSFHHWLTPAQFAARFGTPAATLAAYRRFATVQGMRLVNSDVLGDFVLVHGTAAQAERTFHVSLHSFRNASGRTFYANVQAPTVPSGVTAVLGLETFHQLSLAPHPGSAVPAQDTCGPAAGSPVYGCIGLTDPPDLWSAYNQPSGDTGQGESVGIIGEGQSADVIAALREFESTRKLPFVPVQVYRVLPGDDSAYSDDSGRVEWELDSQAITGMAPGISELRLYFGTSLAVSQLAIALQTWAGDPQGPHQVNASLGLCESNPALDPLLGAAQHASSAALAQAAVEGRSFFSSAGDTGSGCAVAVAVNGVTYGPVPDASYPAADPNATAVGGTVLYTDGGSPAKRVDEHAWDHGGGGPSHFIAAPSWQAGVTAIQPNQCVPDDGTSAQQPTTCRGTPDVSALSGDGTIVLNHRCNTVSADTSGAVPPNSCPANGYRMVDDTNGSATSPQFDDSFAEGGTSLASPLWAGMWARANAASATPLGVPGASLYPLAGTAAFNDIVEGGNPLPATPGWDYATGLGTPNLSALMTAVDKGNLTPTHPAAQATSDPAVITAQPPLTCATFTGDSTSSWVGPGSSDQLAIVEGDLALDSTGTKLRAVLTVKQYNPSLPAGATDVTYNVFWNPVPQSDGSNNFTSTQVELTQDVNGGIDVSYTDGVMNVTSSQTQYTPNTDTGDTGSITKATDGSGDGLVEIDVPLSNINAKAGDVLTAPQGQSAASVGAPANPSGVQGGGAGLIADQAPAGNSWTVGGPSCLTQPATVVPETPLALLLPLAGVLAAAVALLRRRRHPLISA